MNNKQLMSYLRQGNRNMSEPPIHLMIGETAFCSGYSKDFMNKDMPARLCIIDKKLGDENHTLFFVQTPDGSSSWFNAEFFWTKEQIVRLLVAGPKGKKGGRKYRRIMGKMRRTKLV